jgi:hypothetical protein
MHETSSWLNTIGIAAGVLAAVVTAVLAIRNGNIKFGWGKDGPVVETERKEAPPPAGNNNISNVKIKTHDVGGDFHFGHNVTLGAPTSTPPTHDGEGDFHRSHKPETK